MATIKGLNQDFARPFEWHVYTVTPGSDELTSTVDIPLDTIPQGTVIVDVKVVTTVAEAGATSSALDVEVGAVTLLDCGADSLGSVGVQSANDGASTPAIPASNTALISADSVLNCEIAYSGTATTAPTFHVCILAGRNDF